MTPPRYFIVFVQYSKFKSY